MSRPAPAPVAVDISTHLDERTREELQPPCDMRWPKTTGKCSNPAEHILVTRCRNSCDRTIRRLACSSCASRALTRSHFHCRVDGLSHFSILSLEKL